MKVIDKLSTYASLVGVVGAIGGGFYAWGEFNTRLDILENKDFVVNETVNLDPVNERISILEVDVIDRIKKVDDKIQPVDLTIVFKEIAKIREQIAMIDIPEPVILDPIYQSIKALETIIAEASKQIAIALKENELQDVQIEEIKTKSNNPLSN